MPKTKKTRKAPSTSKPYDRPEESGFAEYGRGKRTRLTPWGVHAQNDFVSEVTSFIRGKLPSVPHDTSAGIIPGDHVSEDEQIEAISSETNANKKLDRIAQLLVPHNEMNCAAVTLHKSKYYIAFNTNLVRRANDLLQRFISQTNYELVTRPANSLKHAEIKLFDKLGSNLSGKYIGISKPCCFPCAMVMNIEGIRTRGYHMEGYTNWNFPKVYKAETEYDPILGGKMLDFMGSNAWMELGKYFLDGKGALEEARRLLQNQLKYER